MPRIAGVNLVAVLAAAVVMYFIGFAFYGLIFRELWGQQTLENHGIVAPGQGATLSGQALMDALQAIPNALDMGPALGMGFLISAITALGIGMVLRLVRVGSLGAALRVGSILWIGFAATTLAYNVVYSSESRIIFMIDLGHLLLAYLAGAAVIFLIDGKALKGAGAGAG